MLLQRHPRRRTKSSDYADWRTTWCTWINFNRKTSVVGRQVKDTSAVSITTVTFQNHRYATRLIFIQSTKLHALPVQHLNMQHTMNIMRNSNPTQLNSNGARRKRGSNNGGGSIQSPSPPPIRRNRKSIIKGWPTVKITNISLILKQETKVNPMLFLRWKLCVATTMNHFL